MPAKTDSQKALMSSLKRLNFSLPKEHWLADLVLIRELIDKVLEEG